MEAETKCLKRKKAIDGIDIAATVDPATIMTVDDVDGSVGVVTGVISMNDEMFGVDSMLYDGVSIGVV